MPDKREAAMRQVLKALKDAKTFTGAWPAGEQAITALAAALEQTADKEPIGWRKKHGDDWAYSFTEDAWSFIRGVEKDHPEQPIKMVEQPAQQESVYFCDYGSEGWGKVDAAMAAENLACGMTVEAYYTRPQAQQPLTALAKSVIDAARVAMDESTEAYDGRGSIKIDSSIAASLSLCLDEYDRAANGIGDKK